MVRTVISPFARPGVVTSRKPADHVSTLKLIEHVFDLPAPPRDGYHGLSDLTDLFDFD
jgi:hypothetical protein